MLSLQLGLRKARRREQPPGEEIAMIRTVSMMIGGLLLLIVACPLHALAKISDAHHKATPMDPGHPPTRPAPRA